MANEFKVRKGLVVNGSGSVILDVQGSQGQLFSVTDQLSGSLFSVNDISGVPVLEAFSDSTVKIGQYLSEAIVVSGSTARITGSIAMAGFSSGSVLFAGPGGSISQNNASFFWDNTNGRLGIGTNAPAYTLDINGNARVTKIFPNGSFGSQASMQVSGPGSGTAQLILTSELNSQYTKEFIMSGKFKISTQYFGNAVYFGNSGTTYTIFTDTNNLAIGSTSDSSDRLQVSGSSKFAGDMVITGSGATSATYGLTIQNSNGVNTFRVRNDGVVTVEAVNTVAVLSMSSNGDSYLSKSTSGTNGISLVGPTSAHHSLSISSFNSDNYSNGALSSLRFPGNFISSTGNTAFSYMLLNGTINQTGTSTSTIRGLYINPTITSASNFRAVEWSNNISGSTSWGLYGVGSAPNYLSGSLSIGPATNEGLSFQYSQDNTLGGSFASRIVSLASGVAYRDLFLVSRAVLFQQQGYINSLYISPNGNTVLNSLTDDGVNKLQVSGSAKITNGLSVTGSIIANDITVTGTLTAQTIVAQTITSSILYSSGSNIFGNSLSNTQDFTGSIRITGSLQLTGDTVLRGSGATNATNALTILNSAGTGSLIVRNDGQIQARSTNAGTPGYSFIDNTDTGLFMLGGGMYTVVDSSISVAYGNNGIAFNAVSGAANNESSANLQLTKTAVGHRLSIWLNATNDFHFEAWESGVGYANNIILNGYNGNVLIGSTTNTGQRLQVAGTSKFGGNMVITGSANITQALTASSAIISGSGTQRLTVVGSGSAQPLFTVQGSQGELFSIVDSLSGSLFSVNDQSGLPIMEVFSDNTILMGNYLDPMLLTTARTSSAAGINTLYTLPTSSYDAVYIDYTIRSGSNARAGNFMAMWSGTSVNFTDNSITEFGTTSGFVFGAHISGSNMVVTGSSSTSGWTVKTIIKAI